MICVVVLQNCVCCGEGETGSCSETCVTDDFIGTEVSIKVEEAIDIKEEGSIKDEEAIDIKCESPEFVSVTSIKTEHEVSFCGVCEVVAAHAFRPFTVSTRKSVILRLTISCIVL
jgi:hypothetical protein